MILFPNKKYSVIYADPPFTRTLDRNKGNQFKVTEKLFTYISPIWRQDDGK